MYLSSSAAIAQLFWEVLGEPGVLANAANGNPVARVGLKDFADQIYTLPGQVQVAGEAVLHAHDALQHRRAILKRCCTMCGGLKGCFKESHRSRRAWNTAEP